MASSDTAWHQSERSLNFAARCNPVQLPLRDRAGFPRNGVRADVNPGRERPGFDARRTVLRDSPVAATTARMRMKTFMSLMFISIPFSSGWDGDDAVGGRARRQACDWHQLLAGVVVGNCAESAAAEPCQGFADRFQGIGAAGSVSVEEAHAIITPKTEDKMLVKFMAAISIAVGLAVLAAASLVFFLIWPDKDSSMPAWIQAVGSVAAILVAVAIMEIQLRRQERNSLKQTHDEHANLVLSTLFYARDAQELFKVVREAITASEQMPLPLLSFASDRVASTLSNINAIPIWKMAATDALHLAIIQTSCKNFSASLQTIAYAEQRATRSPHTQPGARMIAVIGLRNGAQISERDTTDSLMRLHSSYTFLTDDRAPGFPLPP